MSDDLTRRLEEAWADVTARADGDDSWAREPLRGLVRATAARPELQGLFPYSSLGALCFSRCSDYPYTLDCPCIGVSKVGFVVVGNPAATDEPPPILGEASDLEVAIQALVDNLPSDRTVWLGSRDDL